MDTLKFKSLKELQDFILQEAQKIDNAGEPTELKMNKLDRLDNSDGAAYVKVNEKGTFSKKTDAPINTPKEYEPTKDPVEIEMKERDGGHDEEIAAATKIQGSNAKKSSPDYAKGQAKPDVESKKDQPSTTKENDPTQEGGKPGGKENNPEMNSEDKESSDTTPKTQVLGKGNIGKDGFSKGQTDKQINAKAKNETDEIENKLRQSIETIQLPEGFKSKKEMLDFIKKSAINLIRKK